MQVQLLGTVTTATITANTVVIISMTVTVTNTDIVATISNSYRTKSKEFKCI